MDPVVMSPVQIAAEIAALRVNTPRNASPVDPRRIRLAALRLEQNRRALA